MVIVGPYDALMPLSEFKLDFYVIPFSINGSMIGAN